MPTQSWEWNPIVVREYRARWRGWSAFALLFGYAAALALALFWRYAEASELGDGPSSPLDRVEALGAELFLILTWMQSLAWTLISPAIAATSIASEREDGMLEAMQLSPLSPAKIIFGKLVSALSLVSLLLLVSLPIIATCFLMGGVAPEDFLSALLLHSTTAFFGVTLGLACSAWSRRANAALRSAYVLVVAWLIASLMCFVAANPFVGGKLHLLTQLACTLIGWSHPLVATAAISDANSMGAPGLLSGWGILESSPWLISVFFQLVASGVLLWSATRAVRRPFPEQYWLGSHNARSTPIAANQSGASTSNPKQKRQPSDWLSIPVFSRLQFSNPVLQREARAKFRMRRPPVWLLVFEIVLALFVGYFYMFCLWSALTDPFARDTIWWVISFTALTVVALTAAVSGANAFTRERETKTWEALRLSLVSPGEIINAKLGATLIGFAVFSIPLWPLLLPCIEFNFRTGEPSAGISAPGGVSLSQAILSVGIIAATAVCYTLWGMIWSWRCRKTAAAVGWSLGSLFFILVFAPLFLAVGAIFNSGNGSEEAIWIFHPFFALGMAASEENIGASAAAIALFLLVALGLRRYLKSQLQIETT